VYDYDFVNNEDETAASNVAPPTGQWASLVFTGTWGDWNGNNYSGTLGFYLNGQPVGGLGLATLLPPPQPAYPFRIGASASGADGWAGALDDVRIYGRALSSDEVAQLYQYESTEAIPHDATATAAVDNGSVVSATITDWGFGYTNTPSVRIIGGGGSGAQAVAVVSNGVVSAVNVLAAGSGYTDTPVVVIAPPFIPQPTIGITALVFGPLVTPLLELNLASLSPYDNYQLEFTPVPGGTWTNLGSVFTPTAATDTQYVNTIGNVGFLRARYVP
jgi:hypothetical protein